MPALAPKVSLRSKPRGLQLRPTPYLQRHRGHQKSGKSQRRYKSTSLAVCELDGHRTPFSPQASRIFAPWARLISSMLSSKAGATAYDARSLPALVGRKPHLGSHVAPRAVGGNEIAFRRF